MTQPPSPQAATTQQLPPVIAPPLNDVAANAEASTLFEAGAKLDMRVRAWAAYGALVVAAVLYLFGLLVIGSVFLWPCLSSNEIAALTLNESSCVAPATKEGWHLFVAAMAALFTVPTVLCVAVLRAVVSQKRDTAADAPHTWLGEKVFGLLERLASPKA